MKTSDEINEIKKFIEDELRKGMICATKTVKGERVELIYFNSLGGCYNVYMSGQGQTFFTLEEACKFYDSIF